MELSTLITIPAPSFTIGYGEQTLLLGSCFAENIGNKLKENKLNVDINPFGTLYNPASVASALRMLLHPERFTGDDLFRHEGLFHSFAHHSRFSSTSETECLDNINTRLFESAERLKKAQRLIITFGTAFVYKLKSNGNIVANCHKLADKIFERKMLSVNEIASDWESLLSDIWKQNPELKIIFTISPIRHWKDGAHGNQLSKAALFLAVDSLVGKYRTQTAYFPAYEIMMDELRDYRFYADDMFHPSPLAIEYIWQRFAESHLSKESLSILKEWSEIQKALNHKPFQPKGEGYKQFMSQILLKIENISRKIPSFDISVESEFVKSKLN